MVSVTGRVTSIVLRDEYTGLTIANIVPEDFAQRRRRAELIYRVQGYLAHGLVVGEVVTITGQWATDRSGKEVLMIKNLQRHPPRTREGEIVFLASYIQGMTKKTAAMLLDHYGGLQGLIDACQNRPEELYDLLPRAKKVRARLLSAQWDRSELDIDLFTALHSAGRDEHGGSGIRVDQIQKMVRHFGSGPLKVILQTRPYDVVDVPKIGFPTADKIAFYYATQQGRPFDPLDPERLVRGVCHIAAKERESGHVCMPEEYLVDRVIRRLEAPDGSRLPNTQETREKIREALTTALKRRLLIKDFDRIYTRGLHRAESELALHISKLVRAFSRPDPIEVRRVQRFLDSLEENSPIRLNEDQRNGVIMAVTEPVSVLTGGPGSGKTTTSARIVAAIKHLGRSFMLLAPTGKAAKRSSEVIGEAASTIHRACRLDTEEDVHSKRFGRRLTRFDYFDVDYLIIDESSMIDLVLGFEAIRRVKPGRTRIVFIGDVDQLPPVGPGQVFRDLIESGVIPVTRLSKVYRQEGGSPIIDGAIQIRSGQIPSVPSNTYEVRILDVTTSREYKPSKNPANERQMTADIAVRWLLYSIRRYAQDLGIDPVRDIQIYAPQNSGPAGIVRLNELLRQEFNPLPANADFRRGTAIRIHGRYVVQKGDKVMQIENNYRMRFSEGTPDEAYAEYLERWAEREREERRRRRRMAAQLLTRRERGERDVVPVMNGQVGFVTRVDPQAGELEILFDDMPYPVLYRNSEEWQKIAPAWAISIHRSQGSEIPYAFIVLLGSMLNRPLFYTAWTRAKKGVLVLSTHRDMEYAVQSLRGVERYSCLAERLREHLRPPQKRIAAAAIPLPVAA